MIVQPGVHTKAGRAIKTITCNVSRLKSGSSSAIKHCHNQAVAALRMKSATVRATIDRNKNGVVLRRA